MTEFVAFDPNVEAKGAALLATLKGLSFDVTPTLKKHGLSSIEPDGWYPQQAWLDVLREIEVVLRRSTAMDLVSIGARIPDTANWPSEIATVDDVLASIDIAYRMNHRHGEIGYYRSERVDDKTIRVTCKNPYPSDFDYGIIYGTVRKFLPEGKTFFVERADSPCRKNGDDRCIYDVIFED